MLKNFWHLRNKAEIYISWQDRLVCCLNLISNQRWTRKMMNKKFWKILPTMTTISKQEEIAHKTLIYRNRLIIQDDQTQFNLLQKISLETQIAYLTWPAKINLSKTPKFQKAHKNWFKMIRLKTKTIKVRHYLTGTKSGWCLRQRLNCLTK